MRTNEIELLEHIVKSTEMGMDGINNVLKKATEKKLRDELRETAHRSWLLTVRPFLSDHR